MKPWNGVSLAEKAWFRVESAVQTGFRRPVRWDISEVRGKGFTLSSCSHLRHVDILGRRIDRGVLTDNPVCWGKRLNYRYEDEDGWAYGDSDHSPRKERSLTSTNKSGKGKARDPWRDPIPTMVQCLLISESLSSRLWVFVDYQLCCPRGAPGLPCLAWENLLLTSLFVKAAPNSSCSVTPQASSLLLPAPSHQCSLGTYYPPPGLLGARTHGAFRPFRCLLPIPVSHLVPGRVSRGAGKQGQGNPFFSEVIVVPLSSTVWKLRKPKQSLAWQEAVQEPLVVRLQLQGERTSQGWIFLSHFQKSHKMDIRMCSNPIWTKLCGS